MRIGTYLRKSTEEHQEESLEVQRAGTDIFIKSKEWKPTSLVEFSDSGISRAEFLKRPGMRALREAAMRGELDVIITRDDSRLGGDTTRTTLLMQDIIEAGVRLFYYSNGKEVLLGTQEAELALIIGNFASAKERMKTAERTREHLEWKAKQGLIVGGRVFGYDNFEIAKKTATTKRRVEYRINEVEAEVVREIFRRFLAGEGVRTIAKALNGKGTPSPRAGGRGTGSWSPSGIWAMLRNERYRGVLVWGRLAKGYRHGTKVRTVIAAEKRVRVEAPELRIIDEELWAAVQARMAKSRNFSGRAGGGGPKPRYLLTGHARCSECGGPINVTNGKDGTTVIKVYACSWHRNRGDTVCTNTYRRPVERVDAALVAWVMENVLNEEVVVEVLRELRMRLAIRTKSADSEIPKLESQAKKLKAEVARLVEAVAVSAESPAAVMKAISDREARLAVIRGHIEAAKAAPKVLDLEVKAMEVEARKRLGDLQGLLSRNPDEARTALNAILAKPLKVTPVRLPEGQRFRIEGELALGTIFALDTGTSSGVLPTVSPARFELALVP